MSCQFAGSSAKKPSSFRGRKIAIRGNRAGSVRMIETKQKRWNQLPNDENWTDSTLDQATIRVPNILRRETWIASLVSLTR